MANDNQVLPSNFSGDGARSVLSDTTVETINNNMVMADSEVSSPLFKNLESGHSVGQHGRMLTATDPTHVASTSGVGNVSAPPSSMVGWPPVERGHRMNNQTSSPEIDPETVKVTMDGVPVGWKVDLRDHNSYETLTETLDDMFRDRGLNTEGVGPPYLLNGKSEYVLTYKDDEGDLMFAADVPWTMFRSSVKKIRIMKNSEAYGLGYRERTVEAAASEESKTTNNI